MLLPIPMGPTFLFLKYVEIVWIIVSPDATVTKQMKYIDFESLIESYSGVLFLILQPSGDQNKHVGDIIDGNHEKVTFGGQLIRNMLKSDKFVLVNSTSKVIGGPFTRYDPSDPKCDIKKSCLDLAIMSKELLKYLDKMKLTNI